VAVGGYPQPRCLRLLFAARAERALAILATGFYGDGFGMSQQNQFVHGWLRDGEGVSIDLVMGDA
jgi:hypothetical protein